MFSLSLDICLYIRRFTLPERESPVGTLPLEELFWGDLVSHEMRRRAFDLFRKRSYCDRGVQSNQEVHMVSNATDRQRNTLEFTAFLGNCRITAEA